MTPRHRMVAAVAAAAALVAAVLVLRDTGSESQKPSYERVRLTEFAASYLTLPARPAPPTAPSTVWSSGGKVKWNTVPHAAGYEVDGKLVAGTETTGTGRPLVRAVDAYGQRSAPRRAETRETDEQAWRRPLGANLDDFDDTHFDRRWHLTRDRGCVTPGLTTHGRLTLAMNCGRDTATLRARSPMQLQDADELGRVAVVTDAAGPRGKLVIDLVPGTPDLTGPFPPAGTIRTRVDDTVSGSTRAAGVLHRYEVVLTRGGVRLLQDGEQISFSPVVPRWTEASVLVTVSTPTGVGRVEIDTIGFTGSAPPQEEVVETDVVPATLRVLDMEEEAPGAGFARTPLRDAARARLRATVRLGDAGDLTGLVAQLGSLRLPMRPVVDGWSPDEESEVTVAADLPAELLGPEGPDALTPFVLRMPGVSQAQVVESYVEVPGSSGQTLPWLPEGPGPQLPIMIAELTGVTPEQATLVVTMDATTAREVVPVAGFEVHVDGQQAAVVPMPGGVGGRHELVISLPGNHNVEVRLRPEDPGRQTDSVLLELSRSSR